jgi:hypothetical protein
MKRDVLLVLALVAATCVCVMVLRRAGDGTQRPAVPEPEGLQSCLADLEGRLRQVESERDLANARVKELEREVSRLVDEKEGDRQVIQGLWSTLVASTRHQATASPPGDKAIPSAQAGAKPVSDDPRKGTKYDAESVKKTLVACGGDVDAAVQQIVTAEGIGSTLRDHSEQPAYWVAAASLMPDRDSAVACLKEAAALHPGSAKVLAALVEAQAQAGVFDESTRAYVDELMQLDPTNSAAHCYAAYCQFQTGDVAGALASLASASAKGRFADDRIETMMARYDYFLNEGCADPVALGLSAFSLPLEHLGMLRQVGDQSVEQVRSLSAAGRYDDALRVAQDISNVGATVSSSGRFLVYDRVGIALQKSGLVEQRQIYETLGDHPQVQELDARLQALQERSATIDIMVQAFGGVLANMTEADLAGYVDQTVLHGEFSTLQNTPEVVAALAQAPMPGSDPALQDQGHRQ